MKLKLRKQKAGWNGRERFIKTSKFVVPCGAPLYFHSDEKLRRWRAAAWTIQGGKKRGRGKKKTGYFLDTLFREEIPPRRG